MTESTISIRPIRDDDDLDALNDGNHEWAGAELPRRMKETGGDAMFAFHVAEHDGMVVGYLDGFLPKDDNPTRIGFASVWVRPDSRRQGVGSAILDALESLGREHGARQLTTHVDVDDDSSQHWLKRKGASTGGIHLESTLELTDDLPLIPPPNGVSVVVLPLDADDADWHAAHEAHVRLMGDTPDAKLNPSPIPYDVYRALLPDPWQVCVAKTDDGAVVGVTCVFPKSEKDRFVNTMLTGVDRRWRGKGLATALKTAHAISLRDAGWRAIITQNMEGNDHILAANKRLGFQPSNSMFDVIYDIPESSPTA
jgi:GNAT superfamily N-acetyltransferase